MASRPHFSPLGVVLVLGAGCLWPLVVEAAFVTTAAAAFSSSASLTDTETGGATNSANVSLGSSSVGQFDSALGVMTGATLNLTSTRTQWLTVGSTDGPNNGNNSLVISTGEGSSSARIVAPGVDKTFGEIDYNAGCTAGRLGACGPVTSTSSGTPTNKSMSVAESALNGYVGTGSVTVARTAPEMSVAVENKFTGTESATYGVTWAGSISATYEFLLHAAPSFNGDTDLVTLHIDFGDVLKGSSASLAFEIFNLAAFDRVGLDLDSIVGSGDVTALLTDLSAFAGLQPGDSYGYWATLDASTIGQFAATYLLSFSDADVGATASRYDYQLVLNLSGNVVNPVTRQVEPRNNVPEPATLALFTLGIATLPLVRRRRTPS